jgi:hypothetical protein
MKKTSEIISPSKKEEKSFWNWLLPLILLDFIMVFWKVFEKENQKEEIKIEKQK